MDSEDTENANGDRTIAYTLLDVADTSNHLMPGNREAATTSRRDNSRSLGFLETIDFDAPNLSGGD